MLLEYTDFSWYVDTDGLKEFFKQQTTREELLNVIKDNGCEDAYADENEDELDESEFDYLISFAIFNSEVLDYFKNEIEDYFYDEAHELCEENRETEKYLRENLWYEV